LAGIGEEPGHVPALVGKAGDGFCRHWLSRLTSALHKVCVLGELEVDFYRGLNVDR
jgi:hypothetical protein